MTKSTHHSTKPATRRARKPASDRKTPPNTAKPKLLSGGNPQIAKADGDAPAQAYIAAMSGGGPGWKRDVGRRLDAIITRTIPGVRKAVRWNSPFYGVADQSDSNAGGWFCSFHCITKYIKVAFFRGTSLRPMPPVASKQKEVRYYHVFEGAVIDDELFASWVRQAAALPGETCF